MSEINSPYYKNPNVVKCPVHGENITPKCPDCRPYQFTKKELRKIKLVNKKPAPIGRKLKLI